MKNLVFLTGAGISAESGISTFRDSDGLWNNFRIEDVATLEEWEEQYQQLNSDDKRKVDVKMKKWGIL